MIHKWKLLSQDLEFPDLQDYQCINCGSFKTVNIKYPSSKPTYSEVAFDQAVFDEIRSCGEIILEKVLI